MMRRNPFERVIAAAQNAARAETVQGLGSAIPGNQVTGAMNATGEGVLVMFGLLDVTALEDFLLAGAGPDEVGVGRLDVTLFGAPWRLAPSSATGRLDVTRFIDPFILS
jgi:hypothetical protein